MLGSCNVLNLKWQKESVDSIPGTADVRNRTSCPIVITKFWERAAPKSPILGRMMPSPSRLRAQRTLNSNLMRRMPIGLAAVISDSLLTQRSSSHDLPEYSRTPPSLAGRSLPTSASEEEGRRRIGRLYRYEGMFRKHLSTVPRSGEPFHQVENRKMLQPVRRSQQLLARRLFHHLRSEWRGRLDRQCEVLQVWSRALAQHLDSRR